MGIITTKIKKIGQNYCRYEKKQYFCAAIGLWCNGNTTDSGPVIHGSSPCNPTKKADVNRPFCFFTPLLWCPLLFGTPLCRGVLRLKPSPQS